MAHRNASRRAQGATALLLLPCVCLAALGGWFFAPALAGGAQETEEDSAAAMAPAELLFLRGGGLLWARVLGADLDGVDLVRLENGGRLRLPWSFFDGRAEEDLRMRYGLMSLEAEEPMVTAQRIPLVDGGEVVGLVVSRGDDLLQVKTSGGLLMLPIARIGAGIVNVQVPASEIFTRDELYAERLGQLAFELAKGGPEAGAAHAELAAFCEMLLDYRMAVVHWTLAMQSGLDRADLAGRLAGAERKAAVQEQVDALAEIDRRRARGQYARALAELELFLARWPQSPLAEDRARLATRVQRDQARALERQLPARFHHWVVRLVREGSRGMGLAEARDFVEERLVDEVLARVVADLVEIDPTLTPERARAVWETRPRGNTRSATYGLGTWLLGAEAARAGLPAPREETAPTTANDPERAELAARLARYIENQRQAQRANAGRADGPDPEEYWRQMGANARAQWMLAYHAEKAGAMQLTRVGFTPCRECGGSGVLEVIDTGGVAASAGSRLRPCGLCFQVGVVRRVTYR